MPKLGSWIPVLLRIYVFSYPVGFIGQLVSRAFFPQCLWSVFELMCVSASLTIVILHKTTPTGFNIKWSSPVRSCWLNLFVYCILTGPWTHFQIGSWFFLNLVVSKSHMLWASPEISMSIWFSTWIDFNIWLKLQLYNSGTSCSELYYIQY